MTKLKTHKTTDHRCKCGCAKFHINEAVVRTHTEDWSAPGCVTSGYPDERVSSHKRTCFVCDREVVFMPKTVESAVVTPNYQVNPDRPDECLFVEGVEACEHLQPYYTRSRMFRWQCASCTYTGLRRSKNSTPLRCVQCKRRDAPA